MNVRAVFQIGVLAAALAQAVPSLAQVQRTILNPGFEGNNPGGTGTATFQIFPNGVVQGWDSTSGDIELWDTNFQSVPAYEGVVFAEMNANAPGALFQNVCMVNGEVIRWRFAHRARTGGLATQTARFEIASSAGALIQNLQTSAVTSTTAWTLRSNATGVAYTGASGVQRIQFSTPDPGTYGNFLDDIVIGLSPYVEMTPATTSAREGTASPAFPSLRITGTFSSPFNVTVNITGGTATLGTDYTTPSGSNSFTVAIPAGSYQSVAFPLGIVISQDTIVDSGETIQFAIGSNPSAYTIASTTACGASPNAASVHTILDDQIQANDQSVGNVNGAAGANAVVNVLSNDVLEGQPVNAADVTTTVLSPATPIGGGLVPVLNTATGAVNVPPGTPSGTYVIGYRICQVLDPANCATANVTITVAPSSDLVIRKTNMFGVNGNNDQASDTVTTGTTTTFFLVITNNGPDPATGAVVTDVPSSGLTCPAGNAVAISGNGVPPGSFQVGNLVGSGITLAALAIGQSATLSYSCLVN